jgi:hypothetical protein
MPNPDKPLSKSELHGPAKDFLEFCESEFESRGNSDTPFDEQAHREAMNLVLFKLQGAED